MAMGRTVQAQSSPLPSSALSYLDSRGHWREFWNAAAPPVSWTKTPLGSAAAWQKGAAELQWAEISLRGSGEAWRTRLVVARANPSRVRMRLDTAFSHAREAAWTLAKVDPKAILAINAGQFEATMPWGIVVLDGRRWLPAQSGPLAAVFGQDSSGTLRWMIGAAATSSPSVAGLRWAFESYPVVVADDTVPAMLRSSGAPLDVAHRDARAGLCTTKDGTLLLAITRFDVAGASLSRIPFGLTVPEMAGVMGALGCRNAMLLDGGISARLRIRDSRGVAHDWEGLRSVPMGLVMFPR